MRALKGLVRLQALVRGHIERKKWAKRFQRFQAILRAQARARAGRAQISELSHSHSSSQSSQLHQPVRKFCFSLQCEFSNRFEVLFFWTFKCGDQFLLTLEGFKCLHVLFSTCMHESAAATHMLNIVPHSIRPTLIITITTFTSASQQYKKNYKLPFKYVSSVFWPLYLSCSRYYIL